MSDLKDRRIDPADISPDILRQLSEAVQEGERPVLLGHRGERIELPQALNDLLVYIVQAMKEKQAIVLLSENEALTTQTAADLLGMSRPHMVRLLDAGRIPFHRVGTHRRILFKDLRVFQAERDKARRETLRELSHTLDAAGVYDRF